MRNVLWVLMTSAALAFTGPGVAAEDEGEITRIDLISAPFGTGSYVLGSALEEISKKNAAGVRINHSESPGFVFNIKKLASDEALRTSMIIGSGRGVATLATAGDAPFEESYPPVKALANYNLTSVWIATLDPDIQDIGDLEGKTVALGRRPQINWTIQAERVLRVGWDLGDSVDVQYLGTKQAVSALLDGNVDAAVVGGYFDPVNETIQLSPQTTEFMASGRDDIKFLEWGEDAVKAAVESGIPMVPITVPEGSIEGAETDLEVFADTTSWVVSSEFPEETAYQITRTIIENVENFEDYHALGKLMSEESLSYGWERDEIHPGALRAYEEAGILQ